MIFFHNHSLSFNLLESLKNFLIIYFTSFKKSFLWFGFDGLLICQMTINQNFQPYQASSPYQQQPPIGYNQGYNQPTASYGGLPGQPYPTSQVILTFWPKLVFSLNITKFHYIQLPILAILTIKIKEL